MLNFMVVVPSPFPDRHLDFVIYIISILLLEYDHQNRLTLSWARNSMMETYAKSCVVRQDVLKPNILRLYGVQDNSDIPSGM